MTLRRDHVAAAVIFALGIAIFVIGHDLPFGTPASPGPGMLPKLVAVVMMALAVVLLAQAGGSPPLISLEWDDLPHGLTVLAIAVTAAALYTTLGFLVTIGLMLLVVMVAVERMPILTSAAITAVVVGGTYWTLSSLLKSPMPRGILGF